MKLLGATVVPVESRLEDAEGRAQRSDARLGDQRREHVLHHRHGRRPASVSDDGARFPVASSAASASSRCPRPRAASPMRCIACVGGGSNAMGIFYPYIARRERAADRRRGGGRRPRDRQARGDADAPASPACCTATARTCCRTTNGQIIETHSISAGLDYPGVGPEHAWLKDSGPRRVRVDHRRRGARGVPRAVPHRRHHSRRSSRPCARLRGEARADAAAATRSCSSTSPAAATRTCTPSPRRSGLKF